MNFTEVYIYGDKYRLKTDQEKEFVEKIALYVSDNMKDVEKSLNIFTTQKIAVITAFNIAAKYLSLKDVVEGSHKLIEDLNNKISSS